LYCIPHRIKKKKQKAPQPQKTIITETENVCFATSFFKNYFCKVIDDSDFWNALPKSSLRIMANTDAGLLPKTQNKWKVFYKNSV